MSRPTVADVLGRRPTSMSAGGCGSSRPRSGTSAQPHGFGPVLPPPGDRAGPGVDADLHRPAGQHDDLTASAMSALLGGMGARDRRTRNTIADGWGSTGLCTRSGRQDLNLRPLDPQSRRPRAPGLLPGHMRQQIAAARLWSTPFDRSSHHDSHHAAIPGRMADVTLDTEPGIAAGQRREHTRRRRATHLAGERRYAPRSSLPSPPPLPLLAPARKPGDLDDGPGVAPAVGVRGHGRPPAAGGAQLRPDRAAPRNPRDPDRGGYDPRSDSFASTYGEGSGLLTSAPRRRARDAVIVLRVV